MSNYRIQHKVASLVVFLICAYIAWISFTAEPAGAYVFPRLISVSMVVLSIWNLIRAGLGWAKVGETLGKQESLNLVPGVIGSLVMMYFAATFLGFYTCALIGILTLSSFYDPANISDHRAWTRRVVVSVAAVAVLYILFALVLQVKTPTGLLI